MINFAGQRGVDKETCLLGTGIAESDLEDSDALISRDQEMRLIENIILALPDTPALGLELGLQYNMATFGIWGFALRTSRTLRDAAALAMRYLPLSTAYCHMTLLQQGELFGIAMDPSDIPRHLRQFLLERDLATGLNLMRELSLAGMNIVAAQFQGPPPEYAERLAQVCGITPQYHCAHNAFFVRREEADRSLPTYDANLVRMLDDQCRQQLAHRNHSGVTGQVRQQLLREQGFIASLDEIATALAMSPRTLRRKLEQEGTRFRELVDNERHQLAQQLLSNTAMKLDEMAIHLGYTDTASFTRAFRRWEGCAPGEYRKQQA